MAFLLDTNVVSELLEQDAAKAGEIERWLDQVCDTFSILWWG
jgi:predicted nucleic acid-binding protein